MTLLTLLFETLMTKLIPHTIKCVCFAFIIYPPNVTKCHHFVPCWATTSHCWATRLLSLVAHWATTFQSNSVSPEFRIHPTLFVMVTLRVMVWRDLSSHFRVSGFTSAPASSSSPPFLLCTPYTLHVGLRFLLNALLYVTPLLHMVCSVVIQHLCPIDSGLLHHYVFQCSEIQNLQDYKYFGIFDMQNMFTMHIYE